jgi:hypothetical protein
VVHVTAGARARRAEAGMRAAQVMTVEQILDGHVGLEIECLDRLYFNGYVNNLQVGGQVVSFLTGHLGNPIPSPAIFAQIGNRFRADVAAFAADNHVEVIRFAGTTARSRWSSRTWQRRLPPAARG